MVKGSIGIGDKQAWFMELEGVSSPNGFDTRHRQGRAETPATVEHLAQLLEVATRW